MRHFRIAVILVLFLLLPLPASSTPDQYLPELAKDYVFWRTKILVCTQSGNSTGADRARERMRQAESYLFRSTYTETEATDAIRQAEEHYGRNPIRGGC